MNIGKKLMVSLYTLTSIAYALSAFIFRALIIYGLKKYYWIHRSLTVYEEYEYDIKLYLGVACLFLIATLITKFTSIGNYQFMIIGPVIVLSVIMLHIAMKSCLFIDMERLFSRYKHDEDYHITINIVGLSLIVLPIYLGVLLTDSLTHIYLIYLYLITRIAYLDRFEMTAHDCMHRPILKISEKDDFRQRALIQTLNFTLNYITGMLFLYPPHFYYYHHMFNHHRENCGPKDVTSSICYDRNSIVSFCRASLKFTAGWATGIDLMIYLIKNKKYLAARNTFLSQCYFYGFLYLLSTYFPLFALCLLIQHIVDGFMMAITIWRWHGFIDPTDPQNSFKNTTNIIFDSHYTYAFHTMHHEKPGMHYAKTNRFLQEHRNEIVSSNMILLRNLGTLDLIFLQLTNQTEIIAKFFINLGDNPKNLDDISDLLQSRLKAAPLISAMPCYFQSWIDQTLKSLMLSYNNKRNHLLTSYQVDKVSAPPEKLESYIFMYNRGSRFST